MPLMQWSDKLSVGVDGIDSDHKRLVEMVNELNDAVAAARGKEVLGKILDGLVDYTAKHFGREEAAMDKSSYPSALAHKKEHADLVKQVLEHQKQYRAGNTAVLSLQLLVFLKNWLLKHIQGSDKQLGDYLSRKGFKIAV